MGMGRSGWWPAATLALWLAGCASGGPAAFVSEDNRAISYTGDRGVANQPFPANYRSEILAYLRTYLNNPVGIHDGVMAEPVQRTVGGRLRYVACLRFAARESDGSYGPARERAAVYVDGRFDRMIEDAAELCAASTYAPFPELAALTR
ncbi:conserved hypothetical protein; putative signal peptide [Bradyrhizobium sp. ORS 278]|uniref:hypothetical protein n=1 Tax=Bradyrhizobium sp. (strain ORS 278) TaxID=114615 RepID=UPI0001508207|nr:hypothetical protein [Bradyrhizobium sp. ORS 278]CAL76804.1 conserved hypothetical protein; putative signal peptide [Bradyrhizobium sp. ORS 278]